MTDPASLLDTLRQTLSKEYEIEGFVGGGSLGLIFKALEREGRRSVALRAVPPDGIPGLGERVRREARVAINLVHSNIVPVYKVAQAPGLDFYTMKFVDGCTLERLLADQGKLPVPIVLTVLRSIVRALAFAHSRRVIHRDVRGGNIFVDREGNVALSDTGIGRALREQGAAAAGMRSALFASPELCAGLEPVPQSDQYAIGILAFQLLTGRTPFSADTPEAVAELHISAAPPELGALRPDAPKQLLEVVRRVLAKAPAQRFPTTLEFLAAVQAAPLSDEDRDAAVARLQQLASTIPQPPVQTALAPRAPAPAPRVAPPPAPIPAPPAPTVSAPPPPPPPPPAPAAAETAPPEFPELQQKYLEPVLPAGVVPEPPPAPKVSAPPPPRRSVVPPPLPPSLALEPLVPPPAPPPEAPEPQWSEPAAPEAPRTPRRSGVGARASAERPAFRIPGYEGAGRDGGGSSARRKLPIVPIAGGVTVLAVAAIAIVLLTGKREKPATPAAQAAESTSTAAPAAPTETAGTPTVVPTVGWIRIRGDLPDDAVFLVDEQEVSGPTLRVAPGEHHVRLESSEFETWDTTIAVRAGDTLRVRVDLVLKQPVDSTPVPAPPPPSR